jgi:hypothetical protein
VHDYLRLVASVGTSDLDSCVASLDEQRARLLREAEERPGAVSEALVHLAGKRLLASNTLRRSNPVERQAWDDANRWLHERVQQEPAPPWSVGELSTLNAILTGTAGALRDGPLYSCGQPYLAPSEVRGELADLEQHVSETHRDPALVAATMYIAVVTIHPFENGNGRTARLAADRVLLASGHLPLCFLSPIASHVAQMQSGPTRDPVVCLRGVLDAVRESYVTVFRRLDAAIAAG